MKFGIRVFMTALHLLRAVVNLKVSVGDLSLLFESPPQPFDFLRWQLPAKVYAEIFAALIDSS